MERRSAAEYGPELTVARRGIDKWTDMHPVLLLRLSRRAKGKTKFLSNLKGTTSGGTRWMSYSSVRVEKGKTASKRGPPRLIAMVRQEADDMVLELDLFTHGGVCNSNSPSGWNVVLLQWEKRYGMGPFHTERSR